MSYEIYLEELLKPLGIYNMDGTFQRGELKAEGEQLDLAFDWLEELEREVSLVTASDWGVERVAELFTMRPVTSDPATLAKSLAYLLRIGGDSFTVAEINSAISGCGVVARVDETDTYGTVSVMFPEVVGVPDGFVSISEIIENILPAHLAVSYYFWYITWSHLELRIPNFADLDAREITWDELEELVY
ncbi:MAG: DUF2313 domain-containing protein [Eubacteriales bacterium]